MRYIRPSQISRDHLLIFFDVVKLILIIILMLAFVNFNVKLSDEVTATKNNAAKQTELLQAEKQVVLTLNSNTNSIHQQINCVLQFFAQPPVQRTDSSIAQPVPCLINLSSGSSGGATGSTKSGVVSATPTLPSKPAPLTVSMPQSATLATPQSNPSSSGNSPPSNVQPTPQPQPQPAPHPIKSLICTLSLGLLGCK